MTLTAAQARTRLLEPYINARKDVNGGLVVPVALKCLTPVTLNDIRVALRPAYGDLIILDQSYPIAGAGSEQMKRFGPIDITLVGDAWLAANERAATVLSASNKVRNPHFFADTVGWTATAGATIARETAPPAGGIGRYAALLTTTGAGANEGAYFHNSTPVRVTGTYRVGAVLHQGPGLGVTGIRAYLSEYQSDGTTLVGKSTTSTHTPDGTWATVTTTRANIAAGNILRTGVENLGTAATDFYAVGAWSAFSQINTLASSIVTSASGQIVHLLLDHRGVPFDPVVLYDALNLAFGTVAMDLDSANGAYEFSIAA